MLHDQSETREHYRALLERSDAGGIAAVVLREAEAARTTGPHGHFPKAPLSVEDRAGLIYRISSEVRTLLGDRLSAALEQAHLLVLHPRDASQAGLQSLLDAGWSTNAIVVCRSWWRSSAFRSALSLACARLLPPPSPIVPSLPFPPEETVITRPTTMNPAIPPLGWAGCLGCSLWPRPI